MKMTAKILMVLGLMMVGFNLSMVVAQEVDIKEVGNVVTGKLSLAPDFKPGTVKPTVPCTKILFRCPANSVKDLSRPCLSSFDDCKCLDGFAKLGGKCVRVLGGPTPVVPRPIGPCPKIAFRCPANSIKDPKSRCLTSFKDCKCEPGFTKVGLTCKPISVCPKIFFRCPANSFRDPVSKCLTNFDDCKCEKGFSKVGNRCEKDQVFCPSVFFQCPANSAKDPESPCLTSFKDCKCDKGFSKVGDRCEKDRVICPTVFFRCPANSSKKPTSPCLTNIDDCRCNKGFKELGLHGNNFRCVPKKLLFNFKNLLNKADNVKDAVQDKIKGAIKFLG